MNMSYRTSPLTLALLLACGPTPGVTSATGESEGCPVGAEGCPCPPDGCDDALRCVDEVCAPAPAGTTAGGSEGEDSGTTTSATEAVTSATATSSTGTTGQATDCDFVSNNMTLGA